MLSVDDTERCVSQTQAANNNDASSHALHNQQPVKCNSWIKGVAKQFKHKKLLLTHTASNIIILQKFTLCLFCSES